MQNVQIVPKLLKSSIPRLNNKNVLIVGGTHGIGESLANKCVELGANVTSIGLSRNTDLGYEQVVLDVVKHIRDVEKYFLNQDYVLNNIGMYERNTILNTSNNRLRKVLKYNLETMFILQKYSLKHVSDVVVNMSSRPTLDNYYSWSLYTLTKQSVITMTQAAAEEGSQKFYAVCPSRVDTKFRDSLFPTENKKTRLNPEEVADLILRLFSGNYPTGQYYWIKKI